MQEALWFTGFSVALLLALVIFYNFEDARGNRVIFRRLRAFLDDVIVFVGRTFLLILNWFRKSFIRLLFHYGAYRLLKRILRLVRTCEHKIEQMLRQNKRAAREISGERTRNHLDEIADHKEASALSDRQREKMRSH